MENLKNGLQAYVKDHLTASKERGKYICPYCGSGSGPHGTGAFSIMPGGTRWKCFACNESGDLMDLIGKMEGITGYSAQQARAAELAGQPGFIAAEQPDNRMDPIPGTYADYIKKAHDQVKSTDYLKGRGFTDETINRFMLGYDPKDNAIVIPYNLDYGYFTKRLIKPSGSKYVNLAKIKEPLFNLEALYSGQPVFIVEGQLDAISIEQAGGRAVGLCGTAGTGKLIRQLKDHQPKQPLIIALDNDQVGKDMAGKLQKGLDDLGIIYITATWSSDKKDANDMLQADPAKLKADIEANANSADTSYYQGKTARLAEANELAAAIDDTSAANRLKDFINGINENADTPYIPTGFKNFDAETDGGLYAGLYVLGAQSSLGKTTIALQIADQIAKTGRHVMFYSLEMAANELISKSVSRYSFDLCEHQTDAKTTRGITTKSRYSGYSQKEKELIASAIEAYRKDSRTMYLVEGLGSISVNDIREGIEKHITATGQAPVVFIDYLQILEPVDIRATDKMNTDKAVLELKRISRDYKIPVIAVSSFNRGSYTDAANMAAFKESGAIEYGSDMLLALQPEGMQIGDGVKAQTANAKTMEGHKDDKIRQLELKILKNRNGRTGGRIPFTYMTWYNCFIENGPARHKEEQNKAI